MAQARARRRARAIRVGGAFDGRYVAFEILRQQPERVTRLALVDTSAALDSPQRVTQRMAGIQSLKHGRFFGVTARMLPQLVHPKHVHGPIGEEVQAMAKRVGGDAFLRQQNAILNRPDSRPLLSSIKVPTLVAVGDSDILTPPQRCRSNASADRGLELSRVCRVRPFAADGSAGTDLAAAAPLAR